MQFKKTYWNRNSFTSKPLNWKFVSKPMIYSSFVYVKEDSKNLGTLSIRYKLNSERRIDKEWFENEMLEKYGKIFGYEEGEFLRDNAPISFISIVYMLDIEYKKITRELKFKRILDDKEN